MIMQLNPNEPAILNTVNIGLLGGTFDPIHYGHICPALTAKNKLGLDQIWLMPNAVPPHKNKQVTDSQHRLAMAALVCREYPDFKLCDFELKLASNNQPSYSVNSLTELRSIQPNINITFLMGMDSLLNLHCWYRWQALFELCNFAVYCRSGWQLKPEQVNQEILNRLVSQMDVNKTGQIQLIQVTPLAYSSTDIRNRLMQGNLPKEMMPKSVSDYIQCHRLYG